MAPAARSLRFVARNCTCTRLSIRHTLPSIGEQRTFSTTTSSRAEEDVQAPEFGSQEAALRRQIMRLPRPPKYKAGFQNMSEGKAGMGMILPDEDFGEDDISSLAHGQLDEHRERRHYLRIAAWEMPLLSKMAKPFVPPSADQPLRFRYTSYLGEKHPAEKKVVVEFCPADMSLTDQQTDKLMKLLGPRYNPETQIARMSSDMFESQAQNKRYLGDLVDRLLEEARDPTDTFEDVPLDTRHHIIKQKPRFPKEWRIDEERQAALNEARENALLLEEQKLERGELVDGLKAIEAAMNQKATAERVPALLAAGARPKRGAALRARR